MNSTSDRGWDNGDFREDLDVYFADEFGRHFAVSHHP
jgi:hypothetical protein